MKVLIIEERKSIAGLIEKKFQTFFDRAECFVFSSFADDLPEADAVIYSPPQVSENVSAPDLEDAGKVFAFCSAQQPKQFVLISSAAGYVPQHNNTGLITENKRLIRSHENFIANAWQDLEKSANSAFKNSKTKFTVLRPAAVLSADGRDFLSRLLKRKLPVVLPGYDPAIQLLDPEDLAEAVKLAVESRAEGVFNVAPNGAILLRSAIKRAGAHRFPVSRVLQRIGRRILKPFKKIRPVEQLDLIRYSWTVSGEKIGRELNFAPRYSSLETLRRFKGETNGDQTAEDFDEFGMDKNYINFFGRTWFKFMHDYYWRVETDGIERIPEQGRAVLVGVHRGFMPWDAVMFLHEIVTRKGRIPRFLIHPGLIKYPFLFNFHTKLGGVVACRENADYILGKDKLLGIFPEGIRGAFTLYKDAHCLGKFGRNDFVKIAIGNRAPIIPFVTTGSAEIFPILAKLDWKWWKRQTEWDAFPITPTFPFLPPVPLPSKWHTRILPAIHVEEMYEPEQANDPHVVRAVSNEVRKQMQDTMSEMLARRKSVFFGSIFKDEKAKKEAVYENNVPLPNGAKTKVLRRI